MCVGMFHNFWDIWVFKEYLIVHQFYLCPAATVSTCSIRCASSSFMLHLILPINLQSVSHFTLYLILIPVPLDFFLQLGSSAAVSFSDRGTQRSQPVRTLRSAAGHLLPGCSADDAIHDECDAAERVPGQLHNHRR